MKKEFIPSIHPYAKSPIIGGGHGGTVCVFQECNKFINCGILGYSYLIVILF